MNILIICSKLTGGGAERVSVSVANGLSRLGHDVTILASGTTEQDYYAEPNVSIQLITGGKGALQRRRTYMQDLKRAIINQRTSVVVNVLGFFLTESILVCKRLNVPIVFSDHNSFERPPYAKLRKKQWFQKFVESRLCNITTVLTERDKWVLSQRGRNEVVVMPNPLFLPVLDAIPDKQRTILAVGRQDAWHVKGFDILIAAWGSICKQFPEWSLRIVGAATDQIHEKMQHFIDDANAERVDLVPFTSKIADEYKNSEIFVLSSRYEGFGLVLIEAMSQRCACIACDYKSRQSEIITDGHDGLICETDNAEALSNKLSLLLSDDKLRHSLQQQSASNLNRYSEENVAKMWEKLLNNIIIK